MGNTSDRGVGVGVVDMDSQWLMYDSLPRPWRMALAGLPGDVDVAWAYRWWLQGRGLQEWKEEVNGVLEAYGFGEVERRVGIEKLWL